MSEIIPKVEIRDGKLIEFSVGIFVRRKREGREDLFEYFLVDRLKEPFGWASIAGHIDHGETALEAIKREAKEEGGFETTLLSLIFEDLDSKTVCSRGISRHYWYLYTCEVKGEGKHSPDEAKNSGWFTAEEIKVLDLEPAWRKWFEKTGII